MSGPLEGIRVVEFGLFAVAPWAGKHLGALGAEVIKVEDPAGEPSHLIPPYIEGTSALYISANLNKRHVALDLKDPAAHDAILRLLDAADIMIENMRPGTIDRLGIGWDVLSARNPRLILASASAYGSSGPMAGMAGADPWAQAYSGFCSTTGAPGTAGEVLRYMAHIDLTAGSVLTEAVLLALLARERTGVGQRVEVDMLGASLTIQSTRLAEFFATDSQPAPQGSAAATTVPHQAFACSDGKYVAVGVVSTSQWTGFCHALGCPDLIDRDYSATNADRVSNRDRLLPELEAVFATKPSIWWTQRLTAHGVPNSRILDTDWVRTHPQITANEYLVDLPTAHWEAVTVEAPPWKFDGTPLAPQRSGGLKGEHNAEVLAEIETLAAPHSAGVA
jgi:crotonobetainyl-CoA:carnitine CoA-transferase CaiB-like acyl-CoA transferase